DDDDDDEDNKLNNRHHRQQQQQRGAVHLTDEVSPAKRNLLSPTLGGGADLIDVEEKEEEVEIEDETAKAGVEIIHGIYDTVTSIDATAFLRGGRTRDPESLDDGDDQRNASGSSQGIDQTGLIGGSTPPILENGVAQRPSSTYGDDSSVPSISRRPDDHFSGKTANTASDLSSSFPTVPPTKISTAVSPTSLKEVGQINRHKGIFTQLDQLLVLNLAGNRLGSDCDNETTFFGLIRLTALDLSYNAFTRIDVRTFKDVQILDLQNNTIERIESNALPLYNLHTLEPSEKRLQKGAQLFNGLNRLTFSGNAIASVDPLAFRDCFNLKELDLSRNELTTVPDRSPQDLGPRRESEQQPLQRLVPQPRPTNRVQIQDDLPEKTCTW
ncbi:Podocan, partial [Melipona quadrifasciata]